MVSIIYTKDYLQIAIPNHEKEERGTLKMFYTPEYFKLCELDEYMEVFLPSTEIVGPSDAVTDYTMSYAMFSRAFPPKSQTLSPNSARIIKFKSVAWGGELEQTGSDDNCIILRIKLVGNKVHGPLNISDRDETDIEYNENGLEYAELEQIIKIMDHFGPNVSIFEEELYRVNGRLFVIKSSETAGKTPLDLKVSPLNSTGILRFIQFP